MLAPNESIAQAGPSEEALKRSRARLLANTGAMGWLKDTLGLDEQTIDTYKLGLSAPYVDKSTGAVRWEDYLMAPILGRTGSFSKKNLFCVVPRVTRDNTREMPRRLWSSGKPQAYYSWAGHGRTMLFICDGSTSVWALAQLLRGSDLEEQVMLVCSSHGRGGMPESWTAHGKQYWDTWRRVYAGYDRDPPDALTGKVLGDEYARAAASVACREFLRVTPPGVEVRDWADWVRAGGTVEQFRNLLIEAIPVRVVNGNLLDEDDGQSPGEYEWKPVAIEGAYHNGHLYEVIRTKRRVFDDETGLMADEPYITVIRSDGQRHLPVWRHARKGMERTLTLTDGTHIARWPEINEDLTWRWSSIRAWLKACEAGERPKGQPLAVLFRAIQGHLRACVWLPFADDYTLLAAGVVVSYCQAAFDAVPMFLVTGPFGSGKSELGIAMGKVGANCPGPIGAISAATLWRHTHRRRGLTVIDDLEQIGASPGEAPDAMRQTLLVSYKKETATKLVTDNGPKGRKVEVKFSTYGVKVINNTSGADPVLASRMFIVETRRMPKGLQTDRSAELAQDMLDQLRNQLHIWAFSNVEAIRTQYTATYPNASSRSEEIAAPLRVVAALSADAAIQRSLELAIQRQKATPIDAESPEELMRLALTQIIRRSVERSGAYQTHVTVTQLIWEMGTLVDRNFGRDFTTSITLIEKPEVVGRLLKQLYADYDAPQERAKFLGKGLRAYKLNPEFLGTTLETIRQESPDLFAAAPREEPDYRAFCRGCSECPYRSRCDMQAERIKRDGENPRVMAH